MPLFCRTCLESISSSIYFSITDMASDSDLPIQQLLSSCVPELDLATANNAVVCATCVAMATTLHSFQKTCREAEAKLKRLSGGWHAGIDWLDFCNNTLGTPRKDRAEPVSESAFWSNCKEMTVLKSNSPMIGGGKVNVTCLSEQQEHRPVLYQTELADGELKEDIEFSEPTAQDYILEDRSPNIKDLQKVVFRCFTCGKLLDNVIAHKQSGCKGIVKPYCVACNRWHMNISNYKRHVLIHMGKKLFKCHLCNRGFAVEGLRNRHLKDMHNNIT